MTDIFATFAPVLMQRGFDPIPVYPGTKQPKIKNWQIPYRELPPSEFSRRLSSFATHGVGLLMGSPFPDGTTLGALDIDNDAYTRIGIALLGDPPCGRIGKKGAVFFVRVRGPLSNPEFRVKNDSEGRWGKVAECLFSRKLCVIPPTIHPETSQPYRWIGKSLLEVDFTDLPIVEMSNADR